MKKGFTLAEVLITLGVIGVVAAMTMPALIAKYEKHIVLTRLQRTFNVLSNALVAAQAEYGDPAGWTFTGLNDEYTDESSARVNEIFASTYITPYLAKGYDFFPSKSLSDLGYKTNITNRAGFSMTIITLTKKGVSLRLNDGTIIFPAAILVKATGNVSWKGQSRITGVYYYADVNGTKGPNVLGKDVFCLSFYLISRPRLMFDLPSTISYNEAGITGVKIKPYTRDDLIQNCKNVGEYCGYLLQSDGWKFNYDYPW